MKRYEAMSKEDIFKFIVDTKDRPCLGCPLESTCGPLASCSINAIDYLQQEIETKPRILTIKSVEDLDILTDHFQEVCRNNIYNGISCKECKYYGKDSVGCFANFLKEVVEYEV